LALFGLLPTGRQVADTLRQQDLPELHDASGDARFDRADGHIEHGGDFFYE
jgi:hypothetical protein